MIRLKLGQKMLVLFLASSLIPLALVDLTWFRLTEMSLRNGAASQQSLLTSGAASRVDQFITDKVNLLIIHSQTVGIQNLNLSNASIDITNMVKQDADIQQVDLVDASGMERLSIGQQGPSATLSNVSQSDAFRVATFLAGKEYISPVSFDTKQQPFITIAVPLITYDTSQTSSSLSTDESGIIRSASAIKGVLITNISLANLWKNVLSQKLGTNGYAYVVDGQGNLIAYPSTSFLMVHHNLTSDAQVAAFISNPTATPKPTITTSEKGQQVLSSYQTIPTTGWGVIAEEPVSSIFATTNTIAHIGIALFVTVGIAVIGISYGLSKRLTKPLEQLAVGANLIRSGKLDTKIQVHAKDEIGALAHAFNAMAASLSSLLQRTQADSSKLNAILNNVGEGIIAVDSNGKIIMSNIAAAVLIGVLPKSIIDQPLEQWFQWSIDGRPFRPVLEKTDLYKDVTLTSPNQHMHSLDVLVNHIQQDPMGISAILTLIDKTTERELENMKTDFVSMAAHELRTPMTTIRGYLDLILQNPNEHVSDETKGYLQHIQANSKQLVGLINNLLNVSRIERGELTLHMNKVDWTHTVRRAINDQSFSAEAKAITVSYIGPTEPIYILADEVAITEVIDNLISNAINYTPRGGRVTVTIRDASDGLITFVQDNGIGISANDQTHLFTKFYRVNTGLASGSGGTGLGLYISKSITEMHKGTIKASSTEGKGSTFTLKLPHFDQAKYSAIMSRGSANVKSSHGWTTKNITR